MKENLFLETFQDKERAVLIKHRWPTRDVHSTFSEARLAARQIYQKSLSINKPIQICLSGGIDSEAAAEAFLVEKIPFEAVTLRFLDGWNDYDIKPAIEFCEKHNLPQRFIDLDVKAFLESGEYLTYARKYRCNSYQVCVHLWFLGQLRGLPVLGGQQFVPVFHSHDLDDIGRLKNKKLLPQSYIGLGGDRQLSYERYAQIEKRALVVNFMQYTTELAISHQDVPIYQELMVENLKTGTIELTYEKKCRWYAQSGFQAKPKADKYTGFEKLKDYYAKIGGHEWYINDLYRKELEEEMPNRKNIWWAPFRMPDISCPSKDVLQSSVSSRRQAIIKLATAAGLMGAFVLSPKMVMAAGWPCNCDIDCKYNGGGKCGGGKPWDCNNPILTGTCLPPE